MRAFRRTFADDSLDKTTPTVWHRVMQYSNETSRLLFTTVCLLMTVVLFYVSYPKVSLSFTAWFVLAPFVWGVYHVRRATMAAVYGWLAGIGTNAVLLSWIYYTCVHGGGLSKTAAAVAWLGLSALLGLQFALFGVACHFLKKTGGFFPLLAACGWVTLEWLHQTVAFYVLGFPWIMLGYTQWNVPQVLYIASWGGVYGLSFILALVGSSIGWCFAIPQFKKGVWQLVVATLVFAAVYGTGAYMQKRYARWIEHPRSLLSVQAALVQPNIDQYKKWTEQYEDEIAATLKQMGESLNQKPVYLTVWPESAVPGSLTQPRYYELFRSIGQQTGAYQVIGSNIQTQGEQYVGAYLLAPYDEKLTAYRKTKLVPFGEFIPLEGFLSYFTRNIEVMGALGSFAPGPIEQPLLDAGGVKLGTTICYESIFPQLWRKQQKQGAQLFVNITNDAWFFRTAAPYQHLAVNVLRAVENGRPVLRAANTGISAYIDAFGNIEQQSDLFTPALLQVKVPLSVRKHGTFYAQWGDWFAWLCAIIFCTIVVSAIVFWYE